MAAGFDHPSQLAQGGGTIVEITQQIGEGEGVELSVGEGQALGLPGDEPHAVGHLR